MILRSEKKNSMKLFSFRFRKDFNCRTTAYCSHHLKTPCIRVYFSFSFLDLLRPFEKHGETLFSGAF